MKIKVRYKRSIWFCPHFSGPWLIFNLTSLISHPVSPFHGMAAEVPAPVRGYRWLLCGCWFSAWALYTICSAFSEFVSKVFISQYRFSFPAFIVLCQVSRAGKQLGVGGLGHCSVTVTSVSEQEYNPPSPRDNFLVRHSAVDKWVTNFTLNGASDKCFKLDITLMFVSKNPN